MAALAAVCRLVKTGDHIVAGDDLYGGTCLTWLHTSGDYILPQASFSYAYAYAHTLNNTHIGTSRLLSRVVPDMGVDVTNVDTTKVDEVAK